MLASSAAITGLGLLAMPAGSALADKEDIGEFDFFDYLGVMVEQDGEWMDPVALDADIDAVQVHEGEDTPLPADADRSIDDTASPEDSR